MAPPSTSIFRKLREKEGMDRGIYDAARAKELLSEKHYQAMTVDIMLPGQDGISLIRELRLREDTKDLVILDIGLPDGSGLDLLPLLKNVGKSPTPVIIFSAEEVDGEIPGQVEAALVKSRTSNEELLSTIRSLIGTGIERQKEERTPS